MNKDDINNPDDLPVIPPLKRPDKIPPVDGAIAICGECGMRIMPVMGYCCYNNNCPLTPKITC